MTLPIWSYWENRYSSEKPAYLQLCEETIRRHSGDAEFIVVSPEMLSKYVSSLPRNYDAMIPAHKADYLRVRLMHDHGGMWIDADTVVFDRLDTHFLSHLEDNEVASIGSGALAQQMFGSRPGGALISECLDIITRRIESDEPLKWSSIGAEVLVPLGEKHGYKKVDKRAWAHGFKDWQKYLEPGTIDMTNRIACMLYNKMMFDVLKDKSAAEILASDTLLGWMLNTALDQQNR